ncbi:MAG TPA: putative zinc-binding metallopeptidase [Aeromicrobium sp.]|nr:putative zinc-binding metallopeptidase [Aeromicrobium sp.]
MRAFLCRVCGSPLVIEDVECPQCQTAVAYSRLEGDMVPVFNGTYLDAGGARWFRCRTRELSGCNWLVPYEGEQCFSCGLTRTRPPDADLDGLALYPVAEGAKRHLIAELDRIGLPIVTRAEDPEQGLCFDLLSSVNEKITMGHDHGAVTIDLQEGDDVIRVKMQREFREPFRTMLGHFRHEIGHYYEMLLVRGQERMAQTREMFGDETEPYQEAIERHYREGPPRGWEASFISSYATMHPFEDFAETFAHFLHIRDAVDTAHNFRLVTADDDSVTFGDLVRNTWIPLSTALNQINRSMGRRPLYPVRLADRVIEKLEFVAALAAEATPHP